MGWQVEQIPVGFLDKAYQLGKRLQSWKELPRYPKCRLLKREAPCGHDFPME